MIMGPVFPARPERALARRCTATAVLLLLGSPVAAASPTKSNGSTDQLVGTWQGRSLCVTTTRPACSDETVLYRIRRPTPHVEAFAIQADKIVAGRPESMGDLSCRFEPIRQQLICPMQGGQWRFRWDGDVLVGVLADSDGSLVRVIQVRRVFARPGVSRGRS